MMRGKSTSLLIIFVLSLIPQAAFPAHASDLRSLDDALTLLYVSDAILLPEDEIDDSESEGLLFSIVSFQGISPEDDQLLARLIHAKKQERNDLDAAYQLLYNQLRGEGADCEADRVQQKWKEQRQQINADIGMLHQVRGDRRKAFTRLWHSIKRSGRGFWHKIGPIGRNFLRRVGPEALQIVTSGGVLTGGVIKELFKHTAKAMVRERIKAVVYEGIQRLVRVQFNLAQAAGVDICAEEEDQPAEESAAPALEVSEDETSLDLPESGVRELPCTFTLEPLSYQTHQVDWSLTVDWGTRTWTSSIEGVTSDKDVDWYSVWTADASGEIDDQGYFTGSATELEVIYSYGKEGDHYQRQLKWIGAISTSLDRICLYRGGDQEWMTPEWIEANDRSVFIAAEGGFCEALCLTGAGQ